MSKPPQRSAECLGEKPSPREVEIVKPDYQPSAAELAEDTRVDATFDEAVDALTKPVSIRYVDRPKFAD